jgi:glycosyltransferase involved in cell wall biosynthesis
MASGANQESRRSQFIDRPLVVGFLGRLDRKKNVGLIIEAVSTLDGDATLRIAGDGLEDHKASLLVTARSAGIAERIEWLGFVSRAERPTFFDRVDVILLVSEYECFGVAAAEAMSHGICVVVSDQTGIAPIVAEYGCGFVVAADVSSIATALRAVSTDRPLLSQMGSRGPVAVRAELSMDAYGSLARQNYAELVTAAGQIGRPGCREPGVTEPEG